MRALSRWLYLLPVSLGAALIVAAAPKPLRGPSQLPSQYRDTIAVATESAAATRVGIEALRSGASAVDAAISVALTLGVVQPASSGIGGGGFALVWDAHQRKVTALDFREVAPGTLDPAALEYRPRVPVETGRGRMIGVPGEVEGLLELHRRFGRRSFAENAAPAIAFAEGGYHASAHLARLALAYHAQLNWSRELHSLFKPDDWAVGVGRRIVNRALGQTLRRIASEGRKAFYEGGVALEMVQAARATGGFLGLPDLRAYRAIEREPLKVSWEGNTVYTMPPPSAGGLLLAETLSMFSASDLETLRFGSGAYDHLLAETFRGAIVDRMRSIGDPAFVNTDVAALMEKMRLLDRRAHIALDRTRPPPRFFLEEHGTTHFVIVDREENIVSMTTTINDAFGAMVSTPSTGVILNNELDDFSTKATARLVATGARASASEVPEESTGAEGPNEPRPFARPTSSMTPTLVFRDGRPIVALGGSGGLRIATGVTQALLARMIFHQSATDCVAAPRIHTPVDEVPAGEPVIELDEGAGDAVLQDLRSRGEAVRVGPNYSAVQMISIERGEGRASRMSAAADPRKGGLALVE